MSAGMSAHASSTSREPVVPKEVYAVRPGFVSWIEDALHGAAWQVRVGVSDLRDRHEDVLEREEEDETDDHRDDLVAEQGADSDAHDREQQEYDRKPNIARRRSGSDSEKSMPFADSHGSAIISWTARQASAYARPMIA